MVNIKKIYIMNQSKHQSIDSHPQKKMYRSRAFFNKENE